MKSLICLSLLLSMASFSFADVASNILKAKKCPAGKVYNERDGGCVDRCVKEGKGRWEPKSNKCSGDN